MEVRTVKCDQCGIQKGDTNHWFKVIVNNYGLTILHVETPDRTGLYYEYDLCGEACVLKQVTAFLSVK